MPFTKFEKLNKVVKTELSKLIFETEELNWLEERIEVENETFYYNLPNLGTKE